jgi:DNA-binding MarR family transcriptional regulator
MRSMEQIIETLKNLGFSEKEAAVYLALLQLGPATPYQIAKKAEIKRPTAYVIAENLVEKGLIVHVPGEEKKRYIARSPEALIETKEEGLAAAKALLPKIRSLQKGTIEKPSILYFEGAEGVRQAYEYRKKELHGKEIVGFFASGEGASPAVLDVFLEWNEYKHKHGPTVRGITVDSPTLKPFEKYLRPGKGSVIAKFMSPKVYSAKTSIESCDNRFVRICLIESAQTLIIESPQFAEAMKEAFEILWKSLEGKYDKPSILNIDGNPGEGHGTIAI